MTELEAINKMLRAVGSRSVNSLISNQPQVPQAREVLDDVVKRELARGYWFNEYKNKTYAPDTNGFIELPNTVIRIVPCNPDLVLRGNKLYDRYNNTPVFENSELIYEETHLLPFDEIDSYAFKVYCAAMAAAEFVRNEIEDSQKEGQLLQEAQSHFMTVQDEQIRHLQLNVFDTPRINRARSYVRPYMSHGSGDWSYKTYSPKK